MDYLSESEVLRKCFKCENVLYDNLNIVYNDNTFMIVLWNKFQIFVYEDRNLETAAKILTPEFQIQELILSTNYILCLDNSGNVHTISLKFKNPAQKRLKSSFLPRGQNIMCCFQIKEHALSIKYEANDIFLSLHKINTEFHLEKKVKIKYADPWPLPKLELGKCILTSCQISDEDFNRIKDVYKATSKPEDCAIVFMCFDKLTIFTCIFSSKMSEEDVDLIKLHTCPSEICGIETRDDLSILVCLTNGTVIQLDLKDIKKDPNIIHLNIAIDKYIVLNENFIYTDGLSMWRADKFLSDDITFRRFIVKNVKDFVKCGDQLICTSYSNLIYVIYLDDETSYLKASTEEYCAAHKLLNNAEYMYKILEEIEQNNDMIEKVKEEGNYLTVLALSNRQDIMDTLVQQSILVYESYEEAIKENSELFLTESKTQYFEKDAYLFVIKLSTKILQQMFSDIITNVFNDLQIHVSFFTDTKLVKTTSVKLKESLKKVSILTSLQIKTANLSEVNVVVRLISSIPGSHDHKQPVWSCLYRKHTSLKSEHFIKTKLRNENFNTEDSFENLVYKIGNNNHRQIFKFVDVFKQKTNTHNWSMYLKLPSNYNDLFVDSNSAKEIINANTAGHLIKQYTDKEFLDTNTEMVLEIGKQNVKIKIIDEFSTPLLQISSENICIVYNIRQLFSKLVYKDLKGKDGTDREFVKYTLYNVAENLQKELKKCIAEPTTLEAFKVIADHFERNVIGALPM